MHAATEPTRPTKAGLRRHDLAQLSAHAVAAMPAEQAAAWLLSPETGLDAAEATRRMREFGPNALPRPATTPWYRELAQQFFHFFAVLLWIAAAAAWLVEMRELAAAIVLVIVINGAFSFWQQFEAGRAVEALERLLPRRVTVRRNGLEAEIDAEAVVPGDRLLLREGEAIPADVRLVEITGLRVDASSLTGESRPVPRTSTPLPTDGRATTELSNLALAGTSVASGRGVALVYATGSHTEFGRLARLTHAQRSRPSPLTLEIHALTRFVTWLALTLGLMFYAVGTSFAGLTPLEGFMFAVGIIVANVPEGLLPTITLALAMAVQRMAARQALVKQLDKVETLGATTVILTDKTGTLTRNEMLVRAAWTADGGTELAGTGYDPSSANDRDRADAARLPPLLDLLETAALCCDARLRPPARPDGQWNVLGDPTEGAILAAAARCGLSAETLARSPRCSELPFDSARKRMTTIHARSGTMVACVKGAAMQVLPRCSHVARAGGTSPLDDAARREADAAHRELANRGLRVLAVARRTLGDATLPEAHAVDAVERELTLLGFLALEDPPRAEVPQALEACRHAGVRVIMVTGDSGFTAAAVAREIGLTRGEPLVVRGTELDALSDRAVARLLDHDDVLFARATPEHKLRLVEALQNRGEVVAVTGDGVNDAPALRRADIGVAMGRSGTDVARQAADVVLADDNFASIVAAIEEGRAVYDNVRKFVTYILASNVPELVPFLVFVLFRVPLPLTVMQILVVDLGTDLVPALALGAEPPEPDVMRRPPRPRHDRLLNRTTLLRSYGFLGLTEAVLAMGGYFYAQALAGWRPGLPLFDSGPAYATATTMTLATIVACQVGNLLACRSPRQSVFAARRGANRLLGLGIVVELALLALLIYVPPLASWFGLAPLGPWHVAALVACPLVLVALEELRKLVVRNYASGLNSAPSLASSAG